MSVKPQAFESFHASSAAILIFCKAPIPGQVKTRLTTAISPEAAAEIHIQLARQTLAMITGAKVCPVQLWCSPDTEHAFFQNSASAYGVSLHQQQGVDLGVRMDAAFACALAQFQSVLLVGCDCPSLKPEHFIDALMALNDGCDVVLAPAEDGGYSLIGLNQVQPHLFSDINWGSNEVLASTLNKIKKLQLKYFELPEQWDVDLPEDLDRYLGISL